MSDPGEFDTVSFPGGYDQEEQIAAVQLAAMQHVRPVPAGPLARAITEALLRGLMARHPGDPEVYSQPYQVRSGELAGERLSLLRSHLALSWFGLAYWAYGLVAVRSGVSIAEHDGEAMFVAPIRMALGELGVRVSDAECIAEVDRFLPFEPSPHGVEASTLVFLSYVRFLHRAALRRRRVVAPGLSLPDVALVHDAHDADAANDVSRFLASHGVAMRAQPEAVTQATRLLVLLSGAAIGSAGFWQTLERWKDCPVIPMVLCLMPKAALYGAPPPQAPPALWSWLGENVAVTLGSETDRYGVLLRALDAPDPRQWWWNEGDSLEIGVAVDVLGQKLPRPATRRAGTAAAVEPYPYAIDGALLSACVLASERAAGPDPDGADRRYVDRCNELLRQRQRPGGQPYALAWFVVLHRAWLQCAGAAVDGERARRELQVALFALGIGTQQDEAGAFLERFAQAPWNAPATTVAGIDERTLAFAALVHHLSQAAVARGQRMRLQPATRPCFVSYARPDEAVARALVAHLEAKGADVWWDLNAITLGAPLDDSLRSAVADATVLFLVDTPAAAASAYVRLEVEAAQRRGLRVVRITDHAAPALDAALAELQRTPQEELQWLQSLPVHQELCRHLGAARQP
jgi:hypothetical protein